MKKAIKFLENKAERIKEEYESWNKGFNGKKPDEFKKRQRPLLSFYKELKKAIEILNKNSH